MVNLTFNLLLERAGINPKDVYLVRHQDKRTPKRVLRSRNSSLSLYELWVTKPREFEKYQQLQGSNRFGKRNHLASFVVTPSKDTLFVGIYKKHSAGKPPADLHECPFSGRRVNRKTDFYYDLEKDQSFSEFEGKLVVNWGTGYRNWVQKADSKKAGNKEIIEISDKRKEPKFAGFSKFEHDISDIEVIPDSWKKILESSKGIYLQRCKDCGSIYVGKADGEEGFWGRFRGYARTGHGGNEGMKRHNHTRYIVTILEVVPERYLGDIDKIESTWKDRLGSREKWGLNKN
jgi:hypothetical protein